MSRRDRHHLDPSLWDERDWREHYRELRYQPLNKEPTPPQPRHTAPTWSLFPAKRSPGGVRSTRVDAVLANLRRR